MRPHLGVAVVGMALLSAGCASPTTGQTAAESTTAGPTSAAASTPAPRVTDDSGRPQVLFDPCNDISPATLVHMGYQRDHKDNSDFRGGDYTFMSCDFRSPDYYLSISSGNITVAEQEAQQERDSATKVVTPITVGGRSGWIARDPSRDQICTMSFSTSYGEVLFDRFQRDKAHESGGDVCGGMEATAQIIASILPPGA